MVEVCAIRFPEFKWLKNVVAVVKSSYQDITFFDALDNLKDEEVESFITKIIEAEHDSILEHITFTFLIFDISQWAVHRLIKQNISSYTLKKNLVKDEGISGDSFVIDSCFPENLLPALNKYYETVSKFYGNLLLRDIKPDDARAILPGSIKTEITWTVSLKALRDFLKTWLNKKVHAEIQELAEKIISIFEELECEYLLSGIIKEREE